VTTVVRTDSSAATKEVAGIVADHVRGGDLLLLVGDMGAGKTTFVQGFALALGVGEPVTSPTFTLVRTYPGRLPVHHVDVYRLERMAEVGDLGLGELIDSNGVTLVEWGDVVRAALPPSYLEVRFEFGADVDDRTITVQAVGPVWHPRVEALATNLAPWWDGSGIGC
jgi:tRNA threonylcarbamoyladenosine biosynthesis protein TsaE